MAINIAFFGLCWGIMSNYVALYGKQVLGITDGTGLFFALLSIGLFTARLHGGSALRNGRIVQSCAMGTVVSLAAICFLPLFSISGPFMLRHCL